MYKNKTKRERCQIKVAARITKFTPHLPDHDDQPVQFRFLLFDSLLSSQNVMLDARSHSTLHVCRSSTEEANPRATLCNIQCSMTTAAPANETSCVRKRKRAATEEEYSTIAATSPQPPWKRVKKPFESRQQANRAYWDSLSKLWFTRRALKELNRRNRQAANPVNIRRPDPSGEPATLENYSSQLKRFARQGGPDLRDLRGVKSAQVVSR